MNAISKAHSSAWLDSKAYRLAWLLGPITVALLVFGSGYWITPGNNLRVIPIPSAYSDEELARLGSGLKRNDPAIVQELRSAAEDDDARALNYMGLLYDPTGPNPGIVPSNLDVALAYFDRASELGSAFALENAGIMLAYVDTARACPYFKRSLEAYPSRSSVIGRVGYCMTFEKDGVAPEKAKGMEMMESAAASGFVRAYLLLGLMYARQSSPDYKQAASNFEKAIAGDIDDGGYAHYQLGSFYFLGKTGIAQDFEKALDHFTKGYEQGSGDSAVDLSFIFSRGTFGRPVDHVKALKYAKFAANAGLPVGHFNAYLHYLNGNGTQKNYRLATNHLLNSIALGYKPGLEAFTSNNKSFPREFTSAVQSRLAKAVIYNGPVSGQMNQEFEQSLKSLLDTKRLFE